MNKQMDALSSIKNNLLTAISLKQQMLEDTILLSAASEMASLLIQCYQQGGKVLFCGNGGSAADAQHLASELSGKYYYDRPPLFAAALHANTSHLTAVANDYSYADVFSRLTEAMGKQGDVLVGISTSGNSANVVKALATAKEKGMTTVGLTGKSGGEMGPICDCLIKIPSSDTPRIQECHILIGHTVCELVEKELFPVNL